MLSGINKLVLTPEAMARALEDAINSRLKDGENYVHVMKVRQGSYSVGDFEVTITTDTEVKNEESDNSTDAS